MQTFIRLCAVVVCVLLGACGVVFGQVSSYQFSTATSPVLAQSGAGSTTLAQGAGITNQNFLVPVGFDFPFNGERFGNINVNADGWVWFAPTVAPVPSQIYAGPLRPLNSNGGSGIISVFGLDLRGAANTIIFTRTAGVAPNRTFTVQWQNITVAVPSGATPATLTTELVLSENGGIRINFGAATVNATASVDAQIGLRGKTATDFQLRAPFSISASQAACWYISYSRNSFPQNVSILFTTPVPPAPPTTFSFSGRIVRSDNANVGIPNPVLLLNNSRTIVGDAQGYFTISGLPNGQHRLRPQIPGITFNPPEDIFTIQNSNITDALIRAPLAILTLSSTLNNARLAGVSYNIQSTTFRGTATTLAATNQASIALVNDSYTITPVLAGYTFNPAQTQVTVANGMSSTASPYAATAVVPPPSNLTTTLSGKAFNSLRFPDGTAGTRPMAGLVVSLVRSDNGSPQNASIQVQTQTTSQDGSFSFTAPALAGQAQYYLQVNSPSRGFSGGVFATFATSGTRVLSSLSVTPINLSFIRGRITQSNGQGLANVSLALSNGRTAVSDNNGFYIFDEVLAGRYTLTASLGNIGYTFSPTSLMITCESSRVLEQNFIASVPMQSGFVAPLLLSPANGTVVEAELFQNWSKYDGLSWTAVPEASGYEVEFAEDMNFTKGLFRPFMVKETAYIGYAIPAATASGTTVYWRVRAVKANGDKTMYSEVRRFIGKTPPPLPQLPATFTVSSGFDPLRHGFSLQNQTSAGAGVGTDLGKYVWVESFFNNISYNESPYTSYKQFSPKFKALAEKRFASISSTGSPILEPTRLWTSTELGLGRIMSVYVQNNGNRTPTTEAVDSWEISVKSGADTLKPWGGSCGGFARASVLNYAGVYNRAEAAKVSTTTDLRTLLHAHQAYQQLGQWYLGDTPLETVRRLKAIFESGDKTKHPVLSVTPNPKSGGHAVVPYRISTNPQNSNIIEIAVYDPNSPGATNRVARVFRDRNTYEYEFWPGQAIWQGGAGTCYIATTAAQERPIVMQGRPILHSEDENQFEAFAENAKIQFSTRTDDKPQPLVTVTSEFGSIQNGKDPLGEDVRFPGAQPIQILTGSIDAPRPGISGFSIPKIFTANTNIAIQPSEANRPNQLSFASGDRLYTSVEWTASDTRGQGLNVNVPNDAVQFTSNSIVPEANLTIAKLDETKAEWENVVRIKLRGIIAGDSLLTHLINDGKSVVIASSGGANSPSKTYDISFTRGVGQFFERLQLKPNEAHTFVIENWDNIEKSGIVQLLDTNKDNTFDEIRTLRTATSIRAASNDGTFAVSVFPNPASTTLTMQFTLADAAHVHAELLNLLGQPVKSLFAEMRTSGVHSFAAETDGLPNGTYFLRIRAGNATVVKPIQIIK